MQALRSTVPGPNDPEHARVRLVSLRRRVGRVARTAGALLGRAASSITGQGRNERRASSIELLSGIPL